MRILFVSGTSVGGAAFSTYELARVLSERGHAVATLVRDESAPGRTTLHRRAVNARVKLAGTPLRRGADIVARSVGRRLTAGPRPAGGTFTSWTAIRPENAVFRALTEVRPDVVVVNSIDLPAWRQLRADLAARDVPVVLYIREEKGLLHLSHSKVIPDLVVANASGHAATARDLGYDAVVVPSIVDCDHYRVDTRRARVLFVNPVQMYGVDIALGLAAARPDIPFAFAQSWPLEPAERAALEGELVGLPNVELRAKVSDPLALYADARILLVPYRYPGRSRVVAEAQCSGIPVLASDLYGIAEAVGPGGLLVDVDGPQAAWLDALSRMWDDTALYEQLSNAAREHSARVDMQPGTIAATFEDALAELLRARTTGAGTGRNA